MISEWNPMQKSTTNDYVPTIMNVYISFAPESETVHLVEIWHYIIIRREIKYVTAISWKLFCFLKPDNDYIFKIISL